MMKGFGVGRRRLAIFGVTALLLGLPAVAMRMLCVGRACDAAAEVTARTPFCSLPSEVRSRLTNGFREGRSGEVLAVSGIRQVVGGSGPEKDEKLAWPATSYEPARVPIVFSGSGIKKGASIASGTGLDDVAPTIAEIIDLARPHPEVRSGEAVEGVATTADPPRLVVELVWKRIGSEDIERQLDHLPALARLIREGAATFDGDSVSLPNDPAALVTTIGTGGTASQHGMTGSLLRNDRGRLVRAWGKDSPINVIATLGDDLDQATDDEAVISLVGSEASDRGLIGGLWYPEGDKDAVSLTPRGASIRSQLQTATRLLERSALGRDDVPDLLGLVQSGPLRKLDGALAEVIEAAESVSGGSATIVVTATGRATSAGSRDVVNAAEVTAQLEQRV
ncbi:MAG TPA: hypothetical protein VFS38_06210, partial [Actinomycetota bacterium]|nr:hypothetical protein [Actinomycetota bacterium]